MRGKLSARRASKVAHEIADLMGESVAPKQIQAMAKVARSHDPDVVRFVDRFLTVVEVKSVKRRALVAGLTQAMKALAEAPEDDPLAPVDDVMPVVDAPAAVALAEAQSTAARRALLREAATAAEAARLSRRSRQSLERFRRGGRVLALREGNQWLYPRWQFDPDAPGGIVPGLQQVIHELRLSPAGAAYWLSRRHERLGEAPIRLLRSRRDEPVLQAARAVGERI